MIAMPKNKHVNVTALADQVQAVIQQHRPEVQLMASVMVLSRIIKADPEGALVPHLKVLLMALQDGEETLQ